MEIVVALVVIAILTLFEAFFVAAEIALVSLRRSRVEQLVDDGHRAALVVRKLKDDPSRFLAVSQLGLTVLGFFASAYAAVSITDHLTEALASFGALAGSAAAISLVTITILLSLFTIVFGELVPKTISLAHPERVALLVARPIDLLARILAPIVGFLTWCTRSITGLLGIKVTREVQMSVDELRLIIERGGEEGILEAEEEQMINAVIELGSRRLHEIMVPRIDMVALPATATYEEAVDLVVSEGHSRIPIYEDSIDEVVGILYAKDLLRILQMPSSKRPELRSVLRTPVLAPESMSIDDLLHEFQRRKVHLAILLDEYGGTAGMATIEDLLEEIVGEIQDEYDTEEPMVVRLSDDEARIDGRADVGDLADIFDLEIELEDEEEYDTVGGLIFHRLGDVPKPGDEIRVDGLTLTVESVDGRRVDKALVVRRHHDDGDASRTEDEAER
jgi:putative hemolysin